MNNKNKNNNNYKNPCTSKHVNNKSDSNIIKDPASNPSTLVVPLKLMEIDFSNNTNTMLNGNNTIIKVLFDSDGERIIESIRNNNHTNQNETYSNLSRYFTQLNKQIDKEYKLNKLANEKKNIDKNKIKRNKNGIRYDLDVNNNNSIDDDKNIEKQQNIQNLKEEITQNLNEFILNKLPQINNLNELNYLYREYIIKGRAVHLHDELKQHQHQNEINENTDVCLDSRLHECFYDICKKTPIKCLEKLKAIFSQIQILHQHINSNLTSKLSDSFALIHEQNHLITFDCMKLAELVENKNNQQPNRHVEKPVQSTAAFNQNQNDIFPIPNDYISGIPDDMINMFNVKEIIENIQNNRNDTTNEKGKGNGKGKEIPKKDVSIKNKQNEKHIHNQEQQIEVQKQPIIDSKQENRLNNFIKLILKIANEINEMNLYQLDYLIKQSSRLFCMQKSSNNARNNLFDSNSAERKKQLESYQNLLNHKMKKFKYYLFKSIDDSDENYRNIYNYLKEQINGFVNTNNDCTNNITNLIDNYFIIKQLYEFDFNLKLRECNETSIFSDLNDFKLSLFDLMHDLFLTKYQSNSENNHHKSCDEYFSTILKPITIEQLYECSHLDQQPEDPRLVKTNLNKNNVRAVSENIDFDLVDYNKKTVTSSEDLAPFNEKLDTKNKYKTRLRNLISINERPKTPEIVNQQNESFETPKNSTINEKNNNNLDKINLSSLSIPPTPGGSFFLSTSFEKRANGVSELTHSESLDDIFDLKKILEEEQNEIIKKLNNNQDENNLENANNKDVLANISNNSELQITPAEIIKNTDSNNNEEVSKENNPNQDDISLNRSNSLLSEKEEKLPHILSSLKKIQENLNKSKDSIQLDKNNELNNNNNINNLFDLIDIDNQKSQTGQDLDSLLLNTRQDSFLTSAESKSIDLNLNNRLLLSIINGNSLSHSNSSIPNVRSPIIDIDYNQINEKNDLKRKDPMIRSCNSTPTYKKRKKNDSIRDRIQSYSNDNTIDSSLFDLTKFKDLLTSSPSPSNKRARTKELDEENNISRNRSESRDNYKKQRTSSDNSRSRSSSISSHDESSKYKNKNDYQIELFQYRPEKMQLQLTHYFNNFKFNQNIYPILTDKNENNNSNSSTVDKSITNNQRNNSEKTF